MKIPDNAASYHCRDSPMIKISNLNTKSSVNIKSPGQNSSLKIKPLCKIVARALAIVSVFQEGKEVK